MSKNIKNAFTLVELLAVIVILAIILVIAVPQVMSVIEDSKKATLESTAKMIASAAEKVKVQNTVLGKDTQITCESVAKINDLDYASCSIKFENNTAKVTIEGSGKFEGLSICKGTKTESLATNESCPISYGDGDEYITDLLVKEDELHNGLLQTYATVNGEQVDAGIRYVGPLTGDNAVKNQVYFNCEPEYISDSKTIKYGDEDYVYKDHCEIWRIIGVFNIKEDEDDTNGIPRIKIVRDQALSTKMEWDTTADGVEYANQWGETTLSDGTTPYPGASLKQYLNGDYYNSLTTIAQGQIDSALWYTGAVTQDTASGVYEDERSNATGTGTTVNYTTTWVGKIGLIYTSDFGYAGINCGDYTIYDYDNANSCGKTNNWLTSLSGYYWTISSYAARSNVAWLINSDGASRINYGVNGIISVRPALYLAHNAQIIGGNGADKPYILSIKN